MRIAQRFNAGIEVWLCQVPKGRLNLRSVGRPFRDLAFGGPMPSVETLRYFRLSLPGQQCGSGRNPKGIGRGRQSPPAALFRRRVGSLIGC